MRDLLVTDHVVFRKGMQKSLSRYKDLEIVEKAQDGVEATALAKHLMPDVVVMDINMPTLNGIDATREIP